MGGCSSSHGTAGPVKLGARTKAIMGFDEADKVELERCFGKIDKDGDGVITYDELLHHLKSKNSDVFMRRVFDVFCDETQQINLEKFCTACWTYCTLDRASLVRFAFDIYDADGSGCVRPEDILHMLQDAYGKRFEKSRYTLSLKKKLVTWQRQVAREGKDIRFKDFAQFTDQNQSILLPAAHIQKLMRKKFLGERYWSKAMSDRREVLKMEGRSKKRIAVVTEMQQSRALSERDQQYEEAFDALVKEVEGSNTVKRKRSGLKEKTAGERRRDYIGEKQNNQKYKLLNEAEVEKERRREAQAQGKKYRPKKDAPAPTVKKTTTAAEVAAAAAAFDKQVAAREKAKRKAREQEFLARECQVEDECAPTDTDSNPRQRLHSVGTSNPSLQQFASASQKTANMLGKQQSVGRQRYLSADAIPNMSGARIPSSSPSRANSRRKRSDGKVFASDDADAQRKDHDGEKSSALTRTHTGRRRSISLNIKKSKKDMTSAVMAKGEGRLVKPKTKQERDEERQKRLTKTVRLDDI